MVEPDLFTAPPHLLDAIPPGLTDAQHQRTEHKLRRMACLMVDWFADRAFTCPDSLAGTIETCKRITVLGAHDA